MMDPVVIAGGGPVGLVTALSLARQGFEVVVLEAEAGVPQDLRAGTFHPPSVEMLDALGVGQQLLARGIPIPEWQIRDRKRGLIAQFDLGLIADLTPYPFRLHCEQWKLSEILVETLKGQPGATVMFSTRCTGFEQDDDGVTVAIESPDGPSRLRASYLVGADGAHSIVRKALGVEFEGFTWPQKFLVVGTFFDLAAHGFAGNAYIADPDEWVAIFKQPHDGPPGLWRIAFPVPAEVSDAEALAEERVIARLDGFLHADGAYEIPYRSIYRVHQRVAKTFRTGRVLLAGDAAHINNPLGGMGLNSGIHDACNLGEKLGAVLRGAGDDLLDRYSRQRRQATVDFVQATTIRNKQLLEEKDPAVREARLQEMRETASDPERARKFLINSSMIASVRKAAEIE